MFPLSFDGTEKGESDVTDVVSGFFAECREPVPDRRWLHCDVSTVTFVEPGQAAESQSVGRPLENCFPGRVRVDEIADDPYQTCTLLPEHEVAC